MKATLIEKILVQGIAFVQGVILARMLCPEDFGLAAMLGIFLAVGAMFAESGLSTALVVLLKDEFRVEGLGFRVGGLGFRVESLGFRVGGLEWKVFRWNVGVALGVYALLAIGAPWIAAWYHQPILKELTWVMGLGIVLNAACVVGGARLQREQEFGKLALVNGAAVFASSIVGVGMAWKGFGVWSIAGVGLAYGACRLIGLWALTQRRDFNTEARRHREDFGGPAALEDETFGEMLSFGLKSMASGLIHTMYANVYQLIIGKMVSPAAVGLFVRGQRWAMLPGDVVNESVGRVSLPALARGETSLGLRVGSLGLRVGWTWVNAALLWPGLVVLWIWAEEIVGFVLGAQWLECVPYLKILIVGQFFTPFSVIAIKKIQACGRAEVLLKTDAIKKPIGIAALVFGSTFGVLGLCWAKVVDDIVDALVDVGYARGV